MLGYQLWTDGACKKNPGIGAYGFCVADDDLGTYFYRGEYFEDTTNNRMELLAIFNGLSYIYDLSNTKKPTIIYTDSAYCANIFLQDWWKKWERESFDGIKNTDIIIPLIRLYKENIEYITVKKVAGHSGNLLNEKMDKLCNKVIKSGKIIIGIDIDEI